VTARGILIIKRGTKRSGNLAIICRKGEKQAVAHR